VGLLALPPGGPAAADAAPLPAALRVYLPAGARLAIDGRPTSQTSSARLFHSPPLEEGKEFHYTLTAEFTRGQERVLVRESVTVRAGRETVVILGAPAPPAGFPAGPAEGGAPDDAPPPKARPLSEQDPLVNAGFQHTG
jgi:uncharacterized protein (TIGR03000 family)